MPFRSAILTASFLVLSLAGGYAGASFNPPQGPNGTVHCLALQKDGRLLVGGLFSAWGGYQRHGLVRLNVDGSLDTGFDAELSRGATVRAIVAYTTEKGDERILVGGGFSEARGKSRRFLVRLKPGDGGVDGSFDTDDGPDGPVHAITVQKNGYVLIGGSFTKFDNKPARGILRLTPKGERDPDFNAGKGVEGTVQSIVVASSGMIYVGGVYIKIDDRISPYIARLAPDGGFDPTFGSRLTPATEPNAGIFALALDSKERLYVGGSFRFITEEGARRDNIVRLKADGSGDGTFNPGVGADRSVNALAPLDGDKLLVGGAFEGFSGFPGRGLVRLDEAGNVDRKFVSAGFDGPVLALAGGRGETLIFAGGSFFNYGEVSRNGVAKLEATGALKTDYGPIFGVNDRVNTMVAAPDGKTILAGRFTAAGGRRQSRIARFDADGLFDGGFGKDLDIDGQVKVAAVLKDGGVIIAGEIRTINGQPQVGIARLTAAGVHDATFNPNLAANSRVMAIIPQDDGKVIVGGVYLNLNGLGVPSIVRLNANGTQDMSFKVGSATNGPVNALQVQPDGKILVGGNFTNVNGVPRRSLARILPEGAVDTTFDCGNILKGDVHTILPLPDGRILAAGEFTFVRRRNVARFLSTGELDSDFKPPAFGLQQPVHLLLPWKKKKIVIAGGFLRIANDPRQRIAVLKEDGDLASDLDEVTTDGTVSAMLGRGDDRILFAGAFSTVNGATALRVAEIDAKGRLLEDTAVRSISSK